MTACHYTLIVEDSWHGANGYQSGPKFKHTFTATPALRTLPDTKLWRIEPPRTRTRDPLKIEFDRTFNFQLLHSGINILNADGKPIAGSVAVKSHEKAWHFVPQNTWSLEELEIVVDSKLEDVAGNNFKELLDHASHVASRNVDRETILITLRPAPY